MILEMSFVNSKVCTTLGVSQGSVWVFLRKKENHDCDQNSVAGTTNMFEKRESTSFVMEYFSPNLITLSFFLFFFKFTEGSGVGAVSEMDMRKF